MLYIKLLPRLFFIGPNAAGHAFSFAFRRESGYNNIMRQCGIGKQIYHVLPLFQPVTGKGDDHFSEKRYLNNAALKIIADAPDRGDFMTIYKNPNCKKVRGSHVLEVSCAHCKCFIARYQKVGESNFVKMYNDRIIEGSIDFSRYHGAVFCPDCGERIATRYVTKMDKKEAYRLVPSAFHKRKAGS